MNDKIKNKVKDETKEPKRTSLLQRIWQGRVRWGYLTGSVAALGLLIPLSQLWRANRENVFLTAGLIFLFALCGFLAFKGIKVIRYGEEAVIVGIKKPTGKVNSLNIYAQKVDGVVLPLQIVFEWIKNPKGQPWQCTNDGKPYFLNIYDIETGKLKPLILPDSQYCDPQEFGNCLTMPAHKRQFERKASLLQQIAPGIMLIGFIASIFFFVVTMPA